MWLGALALGGAMFVLAGLAAAWIAFRSGETGKLRRRITRGLARVRKPFGTVSAARAKRERKLDRVVAEFVAEQRREHLRSIPIEDLKQHGASRVRWSVLKDAGYRTLADVAGVSERRLVALDGVGETTAPRIAEAAARATELAREEPARLPDPDLAGQGAPDAARAGLSVVLFEDELGTSFTSLLASVEDAALAWRDLEPELSLGLWARALLPVLSSGPRARRTEALERGRDLAETLEALATSPALIEVPGRLKRAKKAKAPRNDDELGRVARERYAELCTVLELAFLRQGLAAEGGRGVRGGVPVEIAERVESFPLNPVGLGVTLRSYQAFGAKYMLAQKRTILGDEMGLGKTIQALAAMSHLWHERAGSHFFVVAPAGLVWNWEREISARAPFPAFVLHGDEAEAQLERWRAEGGTAITSYATLRNLELGREVLPEGTSISMLVADEAHYLKNPEARRTKATRVLVDRSDRVCLLSGTPLENHPREFVHLIRLVHPEIVAALDEADVSAETRADAGRFHREVAGVYLRRNQRDVLTELPERIEVEEWIELDDTAERAAYAAEVSDGDFMGMRRATTLTGDVFASSKGERLAEILEDHRESGRKVIVFSFFLDVLEALSKRFDVVGTISGSVPPKDRIELVDRLGAIEGHAILAIQIDAGGTGLNLQCASAVVLTEPQLKPTTEAQAIARAHRMGQTERVVVHRLLARGTVDERVWKLLGEKSELFEAYARDSATAKANAAVEALVAEERAQLA